MKVTDLYGPVPTIEAEQLRKVFETSHPDDIQLLDVRQPLEYRTGHIPGSRLIPVADLEAHVDKLDPNLLTVVYCAAGVRSHAAVAILIHHGFTDVSHLPGGFSSWLGRKATGMPQVDLGQFLVTGRVEEQLALAWLLEQGAQDFYRGVVAQRKEPELKKLFEQLGKAEEGHKMTLASIYEGLIKQPPPADFPAGLVDVESLKGIMEGGFRVEQALQQVADCEPYEVCELAMAVETNAWDHYLWLQRNASSEDSARMFEVLASEERMHLKQLASAMEVLL